MLEFSIVITIIGLILFVISLFATGADWEPFWLWIVGGIIGVMLMMAGSMFGIDLFKSNKVETPDVQQEYTEIVNQYNYCPYCGEEIK